MSDSHDDEDRKPSGPKRAVIRGPMKGGMRQRSDGSWEYYVTFRDPATNRPRKRWHTFRGNKIDAKADRVTKQSAAQQTPAQTASRRTVAEQWKVWLETVSRVHDGNSRYKNKETAGRLHVLPSIGHKLLGDVQTEDLNRLYAALAAGTAPGQKKALSPQSVMIVHGIVAKFFNDAVRGKLIASAPTDRGAANPPTPETYEGVYWNEKELGTALTALKGHAIYLIALIAASTGLRRGEVAALSAEHVDVKDGTLAVEWAVDAASHPQSLKRPKTKTSRRIVTVSPRVLDALALVISEALARAPVPAPQGPALHLLFRSPTGSLLNPDWITGAWGRWMDGPGRQLGLPRIRFHDLRDTHATILLDRGVPLIVVSQRLGHAGVSITEKRYAHVTSRMKRRAAQVTAEVLDAFGP